MRHIAIIQSDSQGVLPETTSTMQILAQELYHRDVQFYFIGQSKKLQHFFHANSWKYISFDSKKTLSIARLKHHIKKLKKYFSIDTVLLLSTFDKKHLTRWCIKQGLKTIWVESQALTLDAPKTDIRFLRKRVDDVLVITSSQAAKNELAQFGFTNNRIISIPNSIDPELMPRTEPVPFINKGIFTIGAIIDFDDPGITHLITGMQNIWDMIPNLYLVVINNSDQYTDLKWMAKKTGIDNRTRFLSKQKNTRAWINSFDIFILPNRNQLFSSRFILEGYQMKTPIIAADHTIASESIIDNQTGLLYEPGNIDMLTNHIIQLYNQPELIKKITQNAHSRLLEKYTHEQMINKYIDILNE